MKIQLLLLLVVLLLTGCSPQEKVLQGFQMDSPYSIKYYGLNEESELIKKVKNHLSKLDYIYSAYDVSSLLYQLNTKKVLSKNKDNNEYFDFLFNTIEYAKTATNEDFDITIRPISKLWDFDNQILPTDSQIQKNIWKVDANNISLTQDKLELKNEAEIELGAVAKGAVCDQIAELLAPNKAIIDMGGTVKNITGKSIKVGVKSPDYEGLLCSIDLPDNMTISTSGSYERNFTKDGILYHHILDKKTGYPVDKEIIAVSVITQKGILADILSTKYFISGRNTMADTSNEGIEYLFVTKDHCIYLSEGIQNFNLINKNFELGDK